MLLVMVRYGAPDLLYHLSFLKLSFSDVRESLHANHFHSIGFNLEVQEGKWIRIRETKKGE